MFFNTVQYFKNVCKFCLSHRPSTWIKSVTGSTTELCTFNEPQSNSELSKFTKNSEL
jgi:hypothetical protein